MTTMRRVLLCTALLALLMGQACGTSSTVDENENVGPGPGILHLSHTGVTWTGYLPLWSVWVGDTLIDDGSNLLESHPIAISLAGVPLGALVQAYGFNTLGQQITYAEGFLGPMGIVLQMP